MMRGLDSTLSLDSVPPTILLSELYDGIPLPEPPAPAVGTSG
jgi:hypothetical protein